MTEQFQFNREKFKDVIHFAIHHALGNYGAEALGKTKLHKIAYYADMLWFLDSGQPMTGASYQRQRFGPTARHLTCSLDELRDDGRISITNRNYYGYAKSEYVSLLEPNRERLSDMEAGLIEHLVGFVCARTAAEISEFSHDDVWSSVPMGERIPYYAAFAMFPAEITDEDIADAKREAAQIAPLIEAERREGAIL